MGCALVLMGGCGHRAWMSGLFEPEKSAACKPKAGTHPVGRAVPYPPQIARDIDGDQGLDRDAIRGRR